MAATVGRDQELESIASFLDEAAPAGILLLEGELGIGKTTLWRAGVDAARKRGYRVLASTAAESETPLSFTGLRDLLGATFDEIGDALPEPQCHALAVTLLREEPPTRPLDPGTIDVAFLGALRAVEPHRAEPDSAANLGTEGG